MSRTIKIGAIAALAIVIGAHAAAAQTLTWGIFRENAPDVTESLRNCWTQAMVSGQTINGEVMAQNLTQKKAETELLRMATQGLCAAERTSTTWTARNPGQSNFGGSGGGRRSVHGSNGGGSDSDWSDDGRSDDDRDRSHDGSRGDR
jgi:hypothetical protein